MDTITDEQASMDAQSLYEKILDLGWDCDKLAIIMGWRCPVCGRGLAPDVKECSCVQKDIAHMDSVRIRRD